MFVATLVRAFLASPEDMRSGYHRMVAMVVGEEKRGPPRTQRELRSSAQ
mgnify:FL=1